MKSKLSQYSTIFFFTGILIILVGSISTIITSSYALQDYKKSALHTQKIECADNNVNINGIDLNQLTQQQQDQIKRLAGIDYEDADTQNSNYNDNDYGLSDDSFSVDNNLVNVCVNVNLNEQIIVSDDDDDGRPIPTNLDLAVANDVGLGEEGGEASDVSIRLGNGDGTFTSTAPDVEVGHFPVSVAVGDFNGDSDLDLAVANLGPSDDSALDHVSIRLGNGDGTFTSAPDVEVGHGPREIAVGDFNGDSDLDLAVVNIVDDAVSIRLGNGDGTFTSLLPDNSPIPDVGVGDGPFSVAVGDFNGDSDLDLAVANSRGDDVSIRLGNGDGTFTSTAPDVEVGTQPQSVAVGDFNGDSDLDLAVANVAVVNPDDADVSIRLGNGDGTFTSAAPDVEVGLFPVFVAVDDFNSDSDLDLAVTNTGDDAVSIRLGNGDGTFTSLLPDNSPIPDVGVGNRPESIGVGDFNGDSNLDLAVANFVDDDVSIRLGNGDGTFTSTAPDVEVGDDPRSVAVGDFDNI